MELAFLRDPSKSVPAIQSGLPQEESHSTSDQLMMLFGNILQARSSLDEANRILNESLKSLMVLAAFSDVSRPHY